MSDTAKNETAGSETAAPKVFGLDDIERKVYTPDQSADALEMIRKIAGIDGGKVKIVQNVKEDDLFTVDKTTGEPVLNFPDGMNIAISPITERFFKDKNGNKTDKDMGEGKGNFAYAAFIGVVPSLDAVQKHANGPAFLRAATEAQFFTKIMNAIRPNKQGVTATPPATLDAFLDNSGRTATLAAFTKFAPAAVEYCRKIIGITIMDVRILRQCLQSSAYVLAMFGPKAEKLQPVMVKIIKNMINMAAAGNMDTSLLQQWLDTRDQVSAGDFDEDALDNVNDDDILKALGA